MFPSGILRVAADASDTSVHSDWWPPDVAPVLRDGLPVAFDPGLDEVSGAGVFGDSPQELWLAALGEHGWSYALGSSHVLGVGQEPTDRWVSPCTAPRSLAVSPHGPLAVIAQRKLNVLSSSGVSLFQSGLDFVDHERGCPRS
jgi:hypothetical protein